ncbi:MAG: cupin domain-containing protein, partial [Gaiellaceae bacterium MAG52_C11]|nr:cupin domain-containing protein [Candidatus Gaiellasilicea maunaloa]
RVASPAATSGSSSAFLRPDPLADELFTRKAGELAFAPRDVPHTHANRTDARARALIICTPRALSATNSEALGGFDSTDMARG